MTSLATPLPGIADARALRIGARLVIPPPL